VVPSLKIEKHGKQRWIGYYGEIKDNRAPKRNFGIGTLSCFRGVRVQGS